MTAGFMVAMRGYDMAQVDRLLARAEQALASADPHLRSTVGQELQTAHFRDRLRGYARHQVDHKIEHLIQELGAGQQVSAQNDKAAGFMIMMRGYDMAQVDQILARAEQALASADPHLRSTVGQELQTAHFRDRLRGYARHQVDHKIEHLIQELGAASESG